MELVSQSTGIKLPPLKSETNNSQKAGFGPHIEVDAGVIDTWPANSTNQRSSLQLSSTKFKCDSTVLFQQPSSGSIRKPKFLEALENFLYHELNTLGCNDVNAISESKLQAFREVFEYLIEEFKTYKPLLSAIKNEYELMLSYQREKIRELESLKQMLVTLADQCDHKLMEFREEERIEIKQLKDEKKKLLEKIMELQQNMLALKCQVNKLHNELALEHERYRDEHDKKKLLIADLNDLRYQQEESKLAELQKEKKRATERNLNKNLDGAENETDNPATLKLALKICRQNLSDCMARLTKMEADYGDVIPRRDYLALETVYNELAAKGGDLEKEFKTLKFENGRLKENCKQLESKLQEAVNQIEALRGNSTPRPDWGKCAEFIDGGSNRWKVLSQGKSSNQLIDVLLNELNGAAETVNSPDFFNGLGVSDDIPLYLRYSGLLRNRKLNKRDTAVTIHDIWKERTTHLASGTQDENPVPMSDFVFYYFKSRFSSDKIAYEWCYNLKDACERFSNNEYIQFFKGVLMQEIDEDIYHYEHKMFSDLAEQLMNAEKKETNSETGFISREVFRNTIKEYFEQNGKFDTHALFKAVDEMTAVKLQDKIDYKSLLSEDDEGQMSLFLKTLKRQLKDARMAYINGIKNIIIEKNVSMNEFRRAILIADPDVNEKDIDRYIKWCFNSTGKSPLRYLDIEDLVKKLQNFCIVQREIQTNGH